MREYNHKAIEAKWQKKWEEEDVYRADDNAPEEKRYVLDMFPYPSGDGLHVGHVEGYTASDIYTRYLRSRGFNVLHPMGWDAFGLPAENYAVKTKVHPKETTKKAIDNFRRQIKSIGLSYDWSREIGTHTPEYYKWTQWLFLLLYKSGFAYKKKASVNWCESCKTVLANEQVVDGACERCGHEVIQKKLEQWFFKITDYAEQLINDLDTVDWPASTVLQQKNWIGRSSGADLGFTIHNSRGREAGEIVVFTTRPDTLFGATYMVLAPEHELVEKLKDSIENYAEVETYVNTASKKTDMERTAEGKDPSTGRVQAKTGVELKGVKAINPANKEEIPVYIADYVLSHYGTGAIMAVPAHDERDFAFARKYDLPIREVVAGGPVPYVGPGKMINSGAFDGMDSEEAKKKITEFVGGKMATTYKLRDWLISRQRYWGVPIPIIYCDACGAVPVPEEDLPVVLPDDVDFMPTGESPLAKSTTFHDVTCPTCGEPARRESDTMDTFVCSSWYYYRFTDPHNTEAFAATDKIETWLPVDLYIGGAEHTVLHLLYSRFLTKVLRDQGLVSFGEPFTALRHQGLILAEDGTKMSKSKGNVMNPDEVVNNVGADTLRIYEMFSGPFNQSFAWSTDNMVGSRRFLERVWRLQSTLSDVPVSKELEMLVHRSIKKVGEDIEHLKFNTAISQLMIFTNELEKREHAPHTAYEVLVRLLAPFAPHITEELWEILGHTSSVHKEPWPVYDEKKLRADTVSIAVQVNGRLRGVVEVPRGASEKDVETAARAHAGVQSHLAGKEVGKQVFVQDKLLNFVVDGLRS